MKGREDSKRAAGRRRKSKGKEIEVLRFSGGDSNKTLDEEVGNASG